MDTVAKRLVGNSYQMEEAIVTVKQFHNEKTNEDVPYIEVNGVIGGCRQKLKADIDRTFFMDFLARYVTPIEKTEA